MTEPQPVHRSSRDPEQLGPRLEAWLQTKLPEGAKPTISNLGGTSATGMSSETLLFDATWTENGKTARERLVARIAPDEGDVPVFPSYDMERQARVIKIVGELTDVPVPRIWGSESDPRVIGAPFFVMEAIEGIVPPDVMPYTFGDNWFYDASVTDQQRLQDTTIDVLAGLHSIDEPEQRFDFLAFDTAGASTLERHIAHTREWYDFAAADGTRSDLVEQAFRWLDDHRPADEGPTVLSWGDSRVGNILYEDFEPVAVLDWEMAGLGPRELDVAWLVFAHRVFEKLAHRFGASGMPHFMRTEDVASSYEARTGHALRDLDFYMAYAGIQWAIVFLRTGMRSVHFGERPMPDDPEEFFHHRDLLEEVLT